MVLQPPSIALTNLFSVVCRLIVCDTTYPSPVSLLPRGFRSNNSISDERYSRSRSSLDYHETNEVHDRLPPIVNTKLGVVEGYFMTVVNGRQIYAFEGIPYAGLTRLKY